MFTRRFFQVVAAVVLAVAVPGTAQSQDAFDRAKSLYLEAAYEDALALLDPSGASSTADVHLYRALCLLALGRGTEADLAIARSIELDPLATAARQDVSPRVAALLTDTRRRLLPDIARRRVADGRLAFQQGDRVGATERFEAAMRLLDDPALANQAELVDLRTLASGFLDLMRAQAAPPPVATAPAALPPAAAAGGASPPAGASSTPAASAAGSQPAATGASVTAAPAAGPPAASLVVTRPVSITQTLPPWRPPDTAWSRRELRGTMLLNIDATGRVTSAADGRVHLSRLRPVAAGSGAHVAIPARHAGRPAHHRAATRPDPPQAANHPVGRLPRGQPKCTGLRAEFCTTTLSASTVFIAGNVERRRRDCGHRAAFLRLVSVFSGKLLSRGRTRWYGVGYTTPGGLSSVDCKTVSVRPWVPVEAAG